jgi:hypothetical protein
VPPKRPQPSPSAPPGGSFQSNFQTPTSGSLGPFSFIMARSDDPADQGQTAFRNRQNCLARISGESRERLLPYTKLKGHTQKTCAG